jgi:hypothetical protein
VPPAPPHPQSQNRINYRRGSVAYIQVPVPGNEYRAARA